MLSANQTPANADWVYLDDGNVSSCGSVTLCYLADEFGRRRPFGVRLSRRLTAGYLHPRAVKGQRSNTRR